MRRLHQRLHERRQPYSAITLATELGLALPEVEYHARVLASSGKVKENRTGVVRACVGFESRVADDQDVIELLSATEAEDEPQ